MNFYYHVSWKVIKNNEQVGEHPNEYDESLTFHSSKPAISLIEALTGTHPFIKIFFECRAEFK